MSRFTSRHSIGPVWVKAPLVLRRYPALAAGLAVGALLLSLSVAAYPLFLSASASRLVRSEVHRPLITRFGGGVTFRSDPVPLDAPAPSGAPGTVLYEARGELFAEEMSANPFLAPAVQTAMGPTVLVTRAGSDEQGRPGKLFSGEGAIEHVEVLRGSEGPGVWLPDLIADALGLGPGDRIDLGSSSEATATVTVDGVYRALYSSPPRGYWLKWQDEIFTECADCAPLPQFILTDLPRFLDLTAEFGAPTASFVWTAPLRPGLDLTLEDATGIDGFVDRFRQRISDESSLPGRVFECCQTRSPRLGRARTQLESAIDDVVTSVTRRLAVIEGPGRLLETAGVAVAVAVLAGAGAFGMAARSAEARLLSARGTGRVVVAAKSALEAVIPAALGAAAGFGLAVLLARVVGPSAGAEAGAGAAWASVLAGVASILVMGVVSAAAFGGTGDHQRFGARVIWRLPFEVAFLAFAFYAYRRLPSGEALQGNTSTVFVLLFPLSLMAGVAMLGARLFRDRLRRLRDRTAGSGPTHYAVVHRLAGAPELVMLLLAASVLSLGAFVQGRSLVRSLEVTVGAKARVFVGAEASAWVGRDAELPPGFPVPATLVNRQLRAGTVDPGGATFDLLAVDPSTFPRAAFWTDGFSDVPIEGIMRRLSAPSADALPVAVAGPGNGSVRAIELVRQTLPVRVVARPTAFPAMYSGRALVVVAEEALRDALPDVRDPLASGNVATEVWVRASPSAATDALSELSPPPYQILTAREVEDVPYIAAVIGTFTVLNVLGLAAGALVVAALLMYLQARQRAQVVAFGLSRRMGLTPGGHRRALFLELAALLLPSYALAVIVALATVMVMSGSLDPLPAIPPRPLLRVPAIPIAVVVLVLAAAARIGAWYATRRAEATHLGEVLRVAE